MPPIDPPELRILPLWDARQDDPLVVDRALNWERGTGAIHVGAIRIECSDWPSPIVVIGITSDLDGNVDPVDVDEAKKIAADAAQERWGDDMITQGSWLPEDDGEYPLPEYADVYRVDLTEAARAGNLAAIRDELEQVARGKRLMAYADGGYPFLYLTNEGDCLCADCATKACTGEQTSTEKAIHWSIFYEGAPEQCSGRDVAIPSAYGDPNASKTEAYVREKAATMRGLVADAIIEAIERNPAADPLRVRNDKADDLWSEVVEGIDEEWPIVDNDGKPFRDLFITLVSGAAREEE